MEEYQFVTLEQAAELPLSRLVRNYNEAVETIRYLYQKLEEEMKENEALWKAYEDVATELYG